MLRNLIITIIALGFSLSAIAQDKEVAEKAKELENWMYSMELDEKQKAALNELSYELAAKIVNDESTTEIINKLRKVLDPQQVDVLKAKLNNDDDEDDEN